MINFESPPDIGTTIPWTRGDRLTLTRVSKYPKADGTWVPMLEWRHTDGRVGTSGLKGRGLYWRTIEESIQSVIDNRASR